MNSSRVLHALREFGDVLRRRERLGIHYKITTRRKESMLDIDEAPLDQVLHELMVRSGYRWGKHQLTLGECWMHADGSPYLDCEGWPSQPVRGTLTDIDRVWPEGWEWSKDSLGWYAEHANYHHAFAGRCNLKANVKNTGNEVFDRARLTAKVLRIDQTNPSIRSSQ